MKCRVDGCGRVLFKDEGAVCYPCRTYGITRFVMLLKLGYMGTYR